MIKKQIQLTIHHDNENFIKEALIEDSINYANYNNFISKAVQFYIKNLKDKALENSNDIENAWIINYLNREKQPHLENGKVNLKK